MTANTIAAAMHRVEAVLTRRPEMGLHDDAPATALWKDGTRIVSRHESGAEVATDMPGELGGSGTEVTPGWLFRAGLASCVATSIAMNAAVEGVELTALEVHASSRSDVRGILGMSDAAGQPVSTGPCDVQLRVRISAHGASADRLRELVEDGYRQSPVPSAVVQAVPVALSIDVG